MLCGVTSLSGETIQGYTPKAPLRVSRKRAASELSLPPSTTLTSNSRSILRRVGSGKFSPSRICDSPDSITSAPRGVSPSEVGNSDSAILVESSINPRKLCTSPEMVNGYTTPMRRPIYNEKIGQKDIRTRRHASGDATVALSGDRDPALSCPDECITSWEMDSCDEADTNADNDDSVLAKKGVLFVPPRLLRHSSVKVLDGGEMIKLRAVTESMLSSLSDGKNSTCSPQSSYRVRIETGSLFEFSYPNYSTEICTDSPFLDTEDDFLRHLSREQSRRRSSGLSKSWKDIIKQNQHQSSCSMIQSD